MSAAPPTDEVLAKLERAALATLAKKTQTGDGASARALLKRVDKLRGGDQKPAEQTGRSREVQAWLKADKTRGYKAAARHFGITVAEARQAGKPGGASADPTPAAASSAGEIVDLDPVARLEWQFDQALIDLKRLQGMDRAATALAGVHRIVRELGQDLDVARAAVVDEDGTTTADLLDQIVLAIADAPEQVLESIELAMDRRRGGSGLRVVDGG